MSIRALCLGSATTAAMLATMASGAQAAERHGWYMGLEGGVVKTNDNSHGLLTNIHYGNGWAGLAEVGYALDGRWRVELEGGYRRNEINTATASTFLGPITQSTHGDLRNYTAMVNAIWDAPISAKWALSLGAGVGVDHVRLAETRNGFATSDTNTVFAAQGLAGLTYQMSTHWDLFMNYRYLWADQPSLTLTECFFLCGPVTDNVDIVKHTLTIGFRYGFDEPPAPAPVVAPPMMAPPPPAHFIIFFGFNKCNITAEADSVLSEAASAAKSMGSASVTIVGHTDTVGSPKYNQKLSECRANAAASNLVGKGVPQGAISASGKGETELMVQTGDGVKEPQNRRDTIDLH